METGKNSSEWRVPAGKAGFKGSADVGTFSPEGQRRQQVDSSAVSTLDRQKGTVSFVRRVTGAIAR